jgi:sodium-coupled neutral amino acid transporter 7/8
VSRAVVEGLWLRYKGMPVEEDVGRERRRRVLQTLVWFLLTLLLALFIPDIGKVISVIGGLAACFIFIFPGTHPGCRHHPHPHHHTAGST